MGKEENRRLVEDKKDSESESCSVFSDSLPPRGLYSPWNSPGQNTGVGSLSLLQGIFSTQGSNPGLPHCRWILYQLSHQGSPVRGQDRQARSDSYGEGNIANNSAWYHRMIVWCFFFNISHFYYIFHTFIKQYGMLHEFACHPWTGAMLIFSVSFQF